MELYCLSFAMSFHGYRVKLWIRLLVRSSSGHSPPSRTFFHLFRLLMWLSRPMPTHTIVTPRHSARFVLKFRTVGTSSKSRDRTLSNYSTSLSLKEILRVSPFYQACHFLTNSLMSHSLFLPSFANRRRLSLLYPQISQHRL